MQLLSVVEGRAPALLLCSFLALSLVASASSDLSPDVCKELVDYNPSTKIITFYIFKSLGIPDLVVNTSTAPVGCPQNGPQGFVECTALNVDCICTHAGQGMGCNPPQGTKRPMFDCLNGYTVEQLASYNVTRCNPYESCSSYLSLAFQAIAKLSIDLVQKCLCKALSNNVGGSECGASCFGNNPAQFLYFEDLAKNERYGDLVSIHGYDFHSCEACGPSTDPLGFGGCMQELMKPEKVNVTGCSFSVGKVAP